MLNPESIRGRIRAYEELRRAISGIRSTPQHKPLILIAHELTASGASLLLANLCEHYAEHGRTVMILTEYRGPIAPEIAPKIAKACAVLRLFFRSETRMRFLRQLRRCGVQEVIGNTVISGVFARELQVCGFRSVFLIHEMAASLRILNAKRMTQDILQYGHKVVFPAAAVRDDFLSFAGMTAPENKICLHPQGNYRFAVSQLPDRAEARHAIRSKLGIAADARILLGVGAVNFGKGIDMILPVLQRLQAQEPPTHLVWLGAVRETDAYYCWLQKQIAACGFQDQVHFAGFVNDEKQYVSYLRGSDVFFLSSREDSFPSVVIEAAMAQLPVLAFRGSGGGAEFVEKERLGLCVEMGEVSAAIEAIQKLCTEPERFINADKVRRLAEGFKLGGYADTIADYLSME